MPWEGIGFSTYDSGCLGKALVFPCKALEKAATPFTVGDGDVSTFHRWMRWQYLLGVHNLCTPSHARMPKRRHKPLRRWSMKPVHLVHTFCMVRRCRGDAWKATLAFEALEYATSALRAHLLHGTEMPW